MTWSIRKSQNNVTYFKTSEQKTFIEIPRRSATASLSEASLRAQPSSSSTPLRMTQRGRAFLSSLRLERTKVYCFSYVESKTQTYKNRFSWKFLSTFFKKWRAWAEPTENPHNVPHIIPFFPKIRGISNKSQKIGSNSQCLQKINN